MKKVPKLPSAAATSNRTPNAISCAPGIVEEAITVLAQW
jgi:hypothetical protein